MTFSLNSSDQVDEEMSEELKENDGFVFNRRRGTANFFSTEALIDFLKRNNLSHVVRAHEVQQVGFQVRTTFISSFFPKLAPFPIYNIYTFVSMWSNTISAKDN